MFKPISIIHAELVPNFINHEIFEDKYHHNNKLFHIHLKHAKLNFHSIIDTDLPNYQSRYENTGSFPGYSSKNFDES